MRSTAPGQRANRRACSAGAAQLGERRRGQPPVDLVEGAPGPDGGERGGERPVLGRRVVDVVRRDDLDTDAGRDRGERVVAVPVERVPVIPELDEHPVPPERGDETLEGATGRGRAVAEQRAGHGTLAAAGQDHPRVVRATRPTGAGVHAGAGRVGEPVEREARRALLPRELPLADRPGEAGVPAGPLGEHDEVLARRVGDPVRGRAAVEGELGAEDGREVDLGGRRGEPDDPVEAVVVGDRQGGEAEAARLVDELLGVARPIEEREVGVAMQLGVGHGETSTRDAHAIEHTFDTTKNRRGGPAAGTGAATVGSRGRHPGHHRLGPAQGLRPHEAVRGIDFEVRQDARAAERRQRPLPRPLGLGRPRGLDPDVPLGARRRPSVTARFIVR